LAQIARDWYADNRERALARMNKYNKFHNRQRAREIIDGRLKCVTCETWKPIEDFCRCRRNTLQREYRCKSCLKRRRQSA
jgi:hypothetical protein